MIQDDPQKLRLALRRRAMDLLARREHSRHDLGNKLAAGLRRAQQRLESREVADQQGEHALINEVLDKLELDNLLSDSRYTETYVSARLNKGYGPLYIRHQLRNKQVDAGLLDDTLQLHDSECWIDQLTDLIKRRTGISGLPERGSKDYLKLQRFVLSRGFTLSQWYEAESRARSS